MQCISQAFQGCFRCRWQSCKTIIQGRVVRARAHCYSLCDWGSLKFPEPNFLTQKRERLREIFVPRLWEDSKS